MGWTDERLLTDNPSVAQMPEPAEKRRFRHIIA